MKNEFLEHISSFLELTEKEENAILELGNFKSFRKGTYLLKEGEIARYYYIVIKGCVRSFYLLDGEEKTTSFYEEGEAVTPINYVDGKPSRHFLQCTEDCILGYVNAQMEERMFKMFPRFEALCRKETEKELSTKQADFDDYINFTPEQRYLKLLQKRPQLILRVPQHQVASFLGIKPETLSRIKKRIMEKGGSRVKAPNGPPDFLI